MGVRTLGAAVAVLLAAAVASQSLAAEDPGRLRRKALRYVEPLPAAMPGAESDTPARIELGRRLFHEPRLSINDTQSCSSCHRLDGAAGVDNLPTSPGARGEFGTRNTPTVLNAGWQIAQFWDGRAADLADQAGQPILNPVEMGMPGAAAVVAKLRTLEGYPEAFAAAFPGDPDPLSFANLGEAIAAFERTLVTRDRFDDFLAGDDGALGEPELRGLKLFMGLNCVSCHDGPLVGGGLFANLGQYAPYPNQEDTGRLEVTGKEEDRLAFKVAPLRNVALTGPYFHDGAVASLAGAVKMMARLQHNRELADAEAADIAAFLGSLSGKGRAGPP